MPSRVQAVVGGDFERLPARTSVPVGRVTTVITRARAELQPSVTHTTYSIRQVSLRTCPFYVITRAHLTRLANHRTTRKTCLASVIVVTSSYWTRVRRSTVYRRRRALSLYVLLVISSSSSKHWTPLTASVELWLHKYTVLRCC